MAEFFKAMPVFNPSITNTKTVFSYAFERDKVFMNTLFKLIVQLQREAGRTGRFTDLAQILHVNLARGSNH